MAGRIPNLQLEEGVLDFDAAGAEVDADCHVVLEIKFVFGESCENARLAHARVA